jgi:hypothetical protein
LPVLGTACSKTRLYINEFFLVLPCLDNGANKSGVMTAMCDIISGFAKVLLKNDLAKTREEHVDEAGEEDEVGFDANGGGSKNGNLPSPPLSPKSVKTGPPFFSDESSLPAIGLQMSQNGHRAIGMYDEGRFLLRTLSHGEASGFNASAMSL